MCYIWFIYIRFWNRPNKCNWQEIGTQSCVSIKCKSILRLFNWNPSDIDLLGTLYLDCDMRWCVNEVSPKCLCACLYNYYIFIKRESSRWEKGVRYYDGSFFTLIDKSNSAYLIKQSKSLVEEFTIWAGTAVLMNTIVQDVFAGFVVIFTRCIPR